MMMGDGLLANSDGQPKKTHLQYLHGNVSFKERFVFANDPGEVSQHT